MLKIGINGFGRIGRMVLRAFFEGKKAGQHCFKAKHKNIKIVCINDLAAKSTNIHLLKHDSVHGGFQSEVAEFEDGVIVAGEKIAMISEPDPEKIDWRGRGVDVVLECSGRFAKRVDAQKHINSGAKKVIVSAPSECADRTVVYGINHKDMLPGDSVVSNGSCTTNCLAPVAFLMDKNFGIESGFMTTIHAYTGDQRLIDSVHSDLRRGRAAGLSMIPSATGAAKAIGLVLPNLAGKVAGTAIRVPTPNVSMVDFVCVLKKCVSVGEVNAAMQTAAAGELAEIFAYNDEPLVSCDFNHSCASSIFDATGTSIVGKNLCRVVAWYDNEFGFSNRMLDLCEYISCQC